MRLIKIKSIKEIEVEPVYMIKTTTSTFIADGIYHHNCFRCNIELKGNYDVFIPKIIHEHSLEWFEEKKRLSKIPIKKNWHDEYERIKTKCEELTCSKDLPF